jgi:hypothetical protein
VEGGALATRHIRPGTQVEHFLFPPQMSNFFFRGGRRAGHAPFPPRHSGRACSFVTLQCQYVDPFGDRLSQIRNASCRLPGGPIFYFYPCSTYRWCKGGILDFYLFFFCFLQVVFWIFIFLFFCRQRNGCIFDFCLCILLLFAGSATVAFSIFFFLTGSSTVAFWDAQ